MAENKSEVKSVIQSEFINQLKNALPQHQSLADVLSDLLAISTDSAYRRLRSETLFSIDEVSVLCNYLKIPFNPSAGTNQRTVTFNYTSLQGEEDGLMVFLMGLKNGLEKTLQFKNREIIFAAEDIPVFLHFRFPHLTRLKCFYWGKSILNQKSFETTAYDPSTISEKYLAVCNDIINLYAQIPSTEIWSEDTTHSSLKQIEFYWDSGFFKNKQQALEICEDFKSMITSIKKQAEISAKTNMKGDVELEDSYKLLQSDVMIGNNCILVKADDNLAVYLSLHTFNNMMTGNYQFCKETEVWIENLTKKSTQISGIGERQRNQFFKRAFNKIDALIEKITNE